MKVLLIILLVILAFIGILSIPFHIYSEYKESFVLYVRYLFVKLYIYPPEDKKKKEKKPKKEKKKEEEPEEEKPEEPEEKKDNFIITFYNNQGVSGIIELIGNVARKLRKGLHKMGRSFYIRKLWLRINVADGDAASTAEKYGKVCAGVYPSLGYILDTVNSRNCSVKISPDFLGSKSQGAFELHLFVIPSKLIGSAMKMGVSLGIELVKIFISNAKAGGKNKANTAVKADADNQK